MKTTSNNPAQSGYSTIETFTKGVRETNVTETTQHQQKIFSAAELWNIQRHTKYRFQRRFL